MGLGYTLAQPGEYDWTGPYMWGGDAALCQITLTTWVAAWRSGNVVGRINDVTLRRARLLLGWVTVFGG